jgi:hypothetical protein
MAGLTRHPTNSSEILFFHKPKTYRHGGPEPPSCKLLQNPIFIITSNIIVMAGLPAILQTLPKSYFFINPKLNVMAGLTRHPTSYNKILFLLSPPI